MVAVTFDTFKFVRRLKDAGIPENQAEAISEAIKETHTNQFEEMAAKRDLKELEGQLSTKADMAKVEVQVLELKRDIKELEYRMTIRLGLMLVAVASGLFAALRYFPPTQPVVISSHPFPTLDQAAGKLPTYGQPAPPLPGQQALPSP